MKFTSAIAPAILATTAIAAPTKTVAERSTEICDQYASITTGSYILYNDLWGEDNASSGSQCTTFDSLSGSTIAWSTSWTWSGGSSDVKSYANVAIESIGKQISSISSLKTTWDWSYSGSDIVADVAYDLFTSASSSGSAAYEIMIWLDALGGAGPISSTGSTVATPTIAGVSWKLYSGPNGDTTVYSFVASSAQESFSGDLLDFFSYLESEEGFSTSQYLLSAGAGTEPFTGSDATLTTSAYSLVIS